MEKLQIGINDRDIAYFERLEDNYIAFDNDGNALGVVKVEKLVDNYA